MTTSHKKPTTRISWWLRIAQAVLLRLVNVDERWTEQAKQAASQGSVVYVLRNRSLVDFLCLEGLVRKHGLPSISFVTGLSPFLYLPWWSWLWHFIRHPSHEGRVRNMMMTVASGHAAAVFLRKPATLGAIGSRPVAVDGIALASEAYDSLDKPVVALPTIFLWGERAMRRLPGTMDFVFGSNEYPRLLRSLWLVLRHRSIHQLTAGTPVNFARIRSDRGFSVPSLTGAVRAAVGRQIEEIRRQRLGSLTKPSSRVKHEVFSSHKLRTELRAIAQEKKMPEAEMLSKTHGIINKLAADVKPRVLSIFATVMALLWKKLYTGIDIDDKSVENIRSAVAGGATLLLPTHKSHIDYLVLSQIMQDHNIMLPHIAAGENLAFWPMGWIFRSCGAFFIRRRFIHDRFYTAVVNTYIRRLIQLRYAIEVFIEGGRSRTGKLLRPKQGMLEMTLQALATSGSNPLWVVPISIGYEQVIEEGAYVRESEGAKKKSESIGGLVKTTKVLLHKYGRLYVRAAQPFSVDQILEANDVKRSDLDDASSRREVAQEIAWRTLQDIQSISIVTPGAVLATAALTLNRATIPHLQLVETTDWLLRFLQHSGAPLSPSLHHWLPENNEDTPSRHARIDEYIQAFIQAKRIKPLTNGESATYQIDDVQRMAVDYYKNNIIHYLVPYSLVCNAALTRKGSPSFSAQAADDYRQLSDLYHWEFLMPSLTEEEAATQVERIIESLEQEKLLSRDQGKVVVDDEPRVLFLAHVLRNYHEVHSAALEIVKHRILSGTTGDTSRKIKARSEEHFASGKFIKPEGFSQINIQNAIAAYKELRILRPGQDASVFETGELGHQIESLLDDYLEISNRERL